MAEPRFEIETDKREVAGNSSSHWTEEIVGRQSCAVCGEARTGDFCAHCGQKFVQKRRSFWELLGELFSRVTDLERGLLFTVISMFKCPGDVCRNYVSGKQRPYINPLTYFFIGAALQILMLWSIQGQFREQIKTQLSGQMPQSFQEDGKLEELLGQPPVEALADTYVSAIMQGYTYISLLTFVIPFALWLWLFHAAVGTRFQVGETLVFALFAFGHMLIMTAVLGSFTFRMGMNPHLAMAALVYSLYPQFAHRGFFKESWPARLFTFLSTALSWISMVLGIAGMFLLTFIIRVVWAMQMTAG